MNIAVVGASNNPEKYGNQIVRHLVDDGHTVFPVNLRDAIILGIPAYKTVGEIAQPIDIIDIVVPPAATLDILKQLLTLDKPNVWVQPGAESEEVIKFLNDHSKEFGQITYNLCIMTSLDRVYTVT